MPDVTARQLRSTGFPPVTRDIAYAEGRGDARLEDWIRCGKATGLRNFPCKDYGLNKVWLELSLTAAALITWAQALYCTGALAHCEPETFRYRMCSIAGRLTRSGRTWRLRLDRDWQYPRRPPGLPQAQHPHCATSTPNQDQTRGTRRRMNNRG